MKNHENVTIVNFNEVLGMVMSMSPGRWLPCVVIYWYDGLYSVRGICARRFLNFLFVLDAYASVASDSWLAATRPRVGC